MEMIQKNRDEVLQEIEEKQTKMKTEAEALIQGLEQEICELKQTSSEVEQLSCSEDHILKTFPSLTAAQHRDWTRVTAPLFLGTVQRAVIKVKKQIRSMYPKPLSESQLMKLQRHAVEVTLDSGTAHPELTVSEDLKQVSRTRIKRKLLNNLRRITGFRGVLGKQSFSSGRHYYEVNVSENTDWVLGIAKTSINRKEATYANSTNGFWTIRLINGEYGAADPHCTPLQVKSVLQKVGVFVDYEEGLVLFYDVDTAVLLYGFTGCSFTEKLCPYFFIGGRENKTLLL
uniref:B30.2/SPRY domain-containing protein n=1 Tax=Neogobius melanostomus TaxID=47308 RepID=A0A8C6TDM7_9GOBI